MQRTARTGRTLNMSTHLAQEVCMTTLLIVVATACIVGGLLVAVMSMEITLSEEQDSP